MNVDANEPIVPRASMAGRDLDGDDAPSQHQSKEFSPQEGITP